MNLENYPTGFLVYPVEKKPKNKCFENIGVQRFTTLLYILQLQNLRKQRNWTKRAQIGVKK